MRRGYSSQPNRSWQCSTMWWRTPAGRLRTSALGGLAEDLVAAVDAMTRREGETYAAFVDRAARHPIARTVKAADLRDNLDMVRRADSSHINGQLAQKYLQALRAAWPF